MNCAALPRPFAIPSRWPANDARFAIPELSPDPGRWLVALGLEVPEDRAPVDGLEVVHIDPEEIDVLPDEPGPGDTSVPIEEPAFYGC